MHRAEPETAHSVRTCSVCGVRAAFTLIEVMIVIGIVVAILAVATPVLVSSFGDRRIEAEAERLGASLASLRAEAVRTRESLALYLLPGEGAYGGEVIIGPFERSDDPSAFDGSTSETAIEESGYRERVVYQAKRPILLSLDRPSNELLPSSLAAGSVDSVGANAMEPELIRIAVCTASGQILASRPLWLSDGRSMYRIEVGTGVGNAVLSSRQIIPDSQLFSDSEDSGDEDAPMEAGPMDRDPGTGIGANP